MQSLSSIKWICSWKMHQLLVIWISETKSKRSVRDSLPNNWASCGHKFLLKLQSFHLIHWPEQRMLWVANDATSGSSSSFSHTFGSVRCFRSCGWFHLLFRFLTSFPTTHCSTPFKSIIAKINSRKHSDFSTESQHMDVNQLSHSKSN